MRWLTKLTYIHADLSKLFPLLSSYAFTDVLSATVEVESAPSQSREQVRFTVVSDDLCHLFTSGHVDVYEAPRMTAIETFLKHRNAGMFLFVASRRKHR